MTTNKQILERDILIYEYVSNETSKKLKAFVLNYNSEDP